MVDYSETIEVYGIKDGIYIVNKTSISWGERNTAVTQFLETFEERQKTFLFCSFLLHEAELFRTMN